MKKIFVLSLSFIVFITGTVYSETITMLAGDFCPYACDSKEENGRIGFTHEILKVIFEKHGYNIKVNLLPWERAFHTFNKKMKDIDGIIGVNRELPIENGLAVFPDTEICQYRHAFYILKSSSNFKNWKYEGIASLKNLKLGAVKGYSYCSSSMTEYVANTPPPKIDALRGKNIVRRNFDKLLKRRIDIWIANIPMAEYFIFNEIKNGNINAENIIKIGDLPCDGHVNAYPVFYNNKKGEKYTEIFTNGMKKLRETGELDKILAKYGLHDWRKDSF